MMDLKVGFVIVCFCALAITYSEAGIPKCCLTTERHIPIHILWKVERWDVQPSTGPCDISALILQVKGMRRPICAHPKVRRLLMQTLQRKKRSGSKSRF